jgi:hypothetical protein
MRTFLQRQPEVGFVSEGLSYKDDVRYVFSMRTFLQRRREECFVNEDFLTKTT